MNQGSPKELHVLQVSYLDTSRSEDAEHTINLGNVFFTLCFLESRTIMSSLLKSETLRQSETPFGLYKYVDQSTAAKEQLYEDDYDFKSPEVITAPCGLQL